MLRNRIEESVKLILIDFYHESSFHHHHHHQSTNHQNKLFLLLKRRMQSMSPLTYVCMRLLPQTRHFNLYQDDNDECEENYERYPCQQSCSSTIEPHFLNAKQYQVLEFVSHKLFAMFEKQMNHHSPSCMEQILLNSSSSSQLKSTTLQQTLTNSGFFQNMSISKRHTLPNKQDYLRVNLWIALSSIGDEVDEDAKSPYPLQVFIQFAKFMLEWNRDGFIHCYEMGFNGEMNELENLCCCCCCTTHKAHVQNMRISRLRREEQVILKKTLVISRSSEESRRVLLNGIGSFCTRWNSSMNYDEDKCNSGHFGMAFVEEMKRMKLLNRLHLRKKEDREKEKKDSNMLVVEKWYDSILECIALRKELPLKFLLPLDFFYLYDKMFTNFVKFSNDSNSKTLHQQEEEESSLTLSTMRKRDFHEENSTTPRKDELEQQNGSWRESLKKISKQVLYGDGDLSEGGMDRETGFYILTISREYSEISSFYAFVHFLITQNGKRHFLIDEMLSVLQFMKSVLLTNLFEWSNASQPKNRQSRECWIQGTEWKEVILNKYHQLIEEQLKIRSRLSLTTKPILYNVKEWHSMMERLRREDKWLYECIIHSLMDHDQM
ncbi:hypothetical protein FDP41_001383 [Naegleria fowleri]|uniref:Uncharacterized protein n=1 Tax=Naegleria fowleri TaxID=5763 RepID=A0A6A5C2I3_NAEFO|nr:uncharacterized protein FDP41_001383 [Naegleria fowleri]KAF0979715.1 hypothetical protein FDP41_001383 [Naegleria fowleri]